MILAFLILFILQLFCRRFGEAGLPEHSINIKMKGSAGQSFCAFMTKGIHVTLEGDANDYVGKVSTSFSECGHTNHFIGLQKKTPTHSYETIL